MFHRIGKRYYILIYWRVNMLNTEYFEDYQEEPIKKNKKYSNSKFKKKSFKKRKRNKQSDYRRRAKRRK